MQSTSNCLKNYINLIIERKFKPVKKDKKLSKENIIKVLDSIYDKALQGLPATPTIEELAEDYLKANNNDKEKAIDSLIKWAVAKSSTSGFVSSVGGLITLPVAIPAGLTASFYIQMRMIAAIAIISGYDPRSDQVKTLIYCCLVGNSGMDFLKKEVGLKVGQKLTEKVISAINKEILIKINRFVGFRLVTKFGEKGVINLGKCIPVVSGFIGGGFDGSSCYISGRTAKKLFFKK